MTVDLMLGDCLEVMAGMPENSVDSVITDPPGGISFMNATWDSDRGGRDQWIEWLASILTECRRVMKPGGALLVWAIPRTSHWTGMAIEDAGFRIIDRITHVFGSGFPKSASISKNIDKAAGAEREVVGEHIQSMQLRKPGNSLEGSKDASLAWRYSLTAPATDLARLWDGWGTALKPAAEDWWLAYNPREGTYAHNAEKWGVAGLWIDGARVETNGNEHLDGGRVSTTTQGWDRPWKHDSDAIAACKERGQIAVQKAERLGRFPANLIHDGSAEVVALFPKSKNGVAIGGYKTASSIYGTSMGPRQAAPNVGYGGHDSAARFFYCAKSSRKERNAGCEGMPLMEPPGSKRSNPAPGRENALGKPRWNGHPCVKPLALMEYLCKLTRTPTGGVVLDPFMGSGTTGIACINTDRDFIGIEIDEDYFKIAEARIAAAERDPQQAEMPLV